VPLVHGLSFLRRGDPEGKRRGPLEWAVWEAEKRMPLPRIDDRTARRQVMRLLRELRWEQVRRTMLQEGDDSDWPPGWLEEEVSDGES